MKLRRRELIKIMVSSLTPSFLLSACAHSGTPRAYTPTRKETALAQDKLGLEFDERLEGHITEGIYDFERGYEGGEPISFDATVILDDLDGFKRDYRGEARLEGILSCKGKIFSIVDGRVKLEFAGDPDFGEGVSRFIYELPCRRGEEGYFVNGFKQLDDPVHFGEQYQTLYVYLHRGSQDGPMIGAGKMKVVNQMDHFLSYKVINGPEKEIWEFFKRVGLEAYFKSLKGWWPLW